MNTEKVDPVSDAPVCVDWEVARSLTGGDDGLLAELIEMFPAESAKHLKAIDLAVEQGDENSLTRAAHTLKSSARLFGAVQLAASALQMEMLGRSSNLEAAPGLLADLEIETARVIEALNQGRPDP